MEVKVNKALHSDTTTSSPADIELGEVMAVTSTAENSKSLRKNFNLVSLAGIGLVTGNVWPALGGSLLASISNGGAPGVLYEYIAASLCYFCIAAVLSELASALPSSSGVLLWSSITAGKRHGRMVGYFAGWWNALAWVFAEASMSSIAGNLCVQLYAVNYPEFVAQPWHTFICYLAITWLSCAVVCLANSAVPHINIAGFILILLGAVVTIIVCTTMAGTHSGFAPSDTVWARWRADIGYPDGFVFVAGMLNGAFAMGTPDATSHLAEEIPKPEVNVPKAILCQYALGFATGLLYLIAILYSINDYDALAHSAFPIAAIYRQATNSVAATSGLLVVILLPVLVCAVGLYVTCGRTLWTLARIGATPFSSHVGQISSSKHMPLYATFESACLVTALGCIELGSSTAFNAFVGSFILHSTASYLAAVVPYLVQRRNPGFSLGPFRMHGLLGWLIHGWACVYMLGGFVVYSFPASLPTDSASMNYTSLIWGSLTIFEAAWWIFSARHKCLLPARMTQDE